MLHIIVWINKWLLYFSPYVDRCDTGMTVALVKQLMLFSYSNQTIVVVLCLCFRTSSTCRSSDRTSKTLLMPLE